VPAAILYDRTKTVVRRHVGRGDAVPLHPEALAFAAHYGFAIQVCAPYRPQTKGRVERQVKIVRDGVVRGRTFYHPAEMDDAFLEWLPLRRAQVHRTHGEVIGVRAEPDRAALSALPVRPYSVSERHLRSVGKDCLVSFESSLYSVPWRRVRRRMRVELRVTRVRWPSSRWSRAGAPRIARAGPGPRELGGGSLALEGLPDGRAGARNEADLVVPVPAEPDPMASRSAKAGVAVGRRDLTVYDLIGGRA